MVALEALFLPSLPLGSVVSVTAAFRGNVEHQHISETMCLSSELFGKVFVKLARCNLDVRFVFDAFDQRGASSSELISDENFVEERGGFLGNGSIKPFEFSSEIFNWSLLPHCELSFLLPFYYLFRISGRSDCRKSLFTFVKKY